MSAPGVFRDTSPGASCGGCERGPTNRPGSVFGHDATRPRCGRAWVALSVSAKGPPVRVGGRYAGDRGELCEEQESGTGGPSRELTRRRVLRPSGHSRFLTALSDSDSASGENDTFCSGRVNGEGGGNAVSHAERCNPRDFKRLERRARNRRGRSRRERGCTVQKMCPAGGVRNALRGCELCGSRRACEGNAKKKLRAPKKRKCLHLCRVRRASGTR